MPSGRAPESTAVGQPSVETRIEHRNDQTVVTEIRKPDGQPETRIETRLPEPPKALVSNTPKPEAVPSTEPADKPVEPQPTAVAARPRVELPDLSKTLLPPADPAVEPTPEAEAVQAAQAPLPRRPEAVATPRPPEPAPSSHKVDPIQTVPSDPLQRLPRVSTIAGQQVGAAASTSQVTQKPTEPVGAGATTGVQQTLDLTLQGKNNQEGGGREQREDTPWTESRKAEQATEPQQAGPTQTRPGAPARFEFPAESDLALKKLQGVGAPSGQVEALASRHAAHTISSLLKRAYRTNDLCSLDEESAMNALGIILKLGGEFTYAHSARVLDLSMSLADELGINDFRTRKQIRQGALLKDIGQVGAQLSQASPDDLEQIGDYVGSQLSSGSMRRAGLLHDIGKVKIPSEILHKSGKLSEEEFQIVKQHPIFGEEIVRPIASLRHLCPTIRGHHERWDGKGYPDGLKGTQIPLAARIIAVADVFDALISPRPYKPGMPLEKVRSIMLEGRGTHFDPMLLDAFMRVIDDRYGRQSA
ncbi:HD domain-containing protein [bacterium CPR1]|nr:HD domain-containing protein [bacterium CPR1]